MLPPVLKNFTLDSANLVTQLEPMVQLRVCKTAANPTVNIAVQNLSFFFRSFDFFIFYVKYVSTRGGSYE